MAEYKSNSYKSKELKTKEAIAEKKVEKVIAKSATTKKNDLRRLTDTFISEDAANVKTHIWTDILVPSIKKAISEIVTDGIDMVLYGNTKPKRGDKSYTGRVVYNRYFEDDRREPRRSESGHSANRFDHEDIVFETRGDAEIVRDTMIDLADTYNFVTVADMYDAAGLIAPHTAYNYGWRNVRSAEAVRLRDGRYTLKLPRPMLID